MKLSPGAWIVSLVCVFLGTSCDNASSAQPTIETRNLPNGIRIVAVHFPTSTNASIFTFLPMGLTSDAPDQSQWSHLVEHLIIRSTVPANSPQANAETLPDHMRLDFYGHTGNWKEGLSHHRRWLEGVPFTEANLAAEKPKVIAECDFTARNFATHKFAVAAWSHGFRHGRKHIALKGDVTRARLSDVQHLRNDRLTVSNHVTVCIVGGLDAKTVFAAAEEEFNALSLRAGLTPRSKAATSNLDLTWDFNARHLLVAWPIPDFRQPEHAAFLVMAQRLNMQLVSDTDLSRQAGMAFAGADLTTPEGSFFFVSASLRPDADFETVRKTVFKQVEQLASGGDKPGPAEMIARQLAASLEEVPEPQALKAQVPTGVSLAMIEGNMGLQLGMHEHRYGDHRQALAREIANVTAVKLQEAARRYLSAEKATVCTLRPQSAPD